MLWIASRAWQTFQQALFVQFDTSAPQKLLTSVVRFDGDSLFCYCFYCLVHTLRRI